MFCKSGFFQKLVLLYKLLFDNAAHSYFERYLAVTSSLGTNREQGSVCRLSLPVSVSEEMKLATCSISILLALGMVASTIDSLELVDKGDFKTIERDPTETGLSSSKLRNLKRQEPSNHGMIRLLKRQESPTDGLIRILKREDSPTDGMIRILKREDSPTDGMIRILKREDSPKDGLIRTLKREDSSTDGLIGILKRQDSSKSDLIAVPSEMAKRLQLQLKQQDPSLKLYTNEMIQNLKRLGSNQTPDEAWTSTTNGKSGSLLSRAENDPRNTEEYQIAYDVKGNQLIKQVRDNYWAAAG